MANVIDSEGSAQHVESALNLSWIIKEKFGEQSPADINMGDCFKWAWVAYKHNKGAQLYFACVEHKAQTPPKQNDSTHKRCGMGHAFVKIGSKYFDSERPSGVSDWKTIVKNFGGETIKIDENVVVEKQSPQEFLKFWSSFINKRDRSVFEMYAHLATAVIKKEGSKYCVRSPKNPNWNGGCYDTKKEAEERLKQVEYFKHASVACRCGHPLWHSDQVPAWHTDQLPGGLADDAKPEDFDQSQLQMGIDVELEHTPDRQIAQEIAMDHLTEDPLYYTKLKKVESSMSELDVHDVQRRLSDYKMTCNIRLRSAYDKVSIWAWGGDYRTSDLHFIDSIIVTKLRTMLDDNNIVLGKSNLFKLTTKQRDQIQVWLDSQLESGEVRANLVAVFESIASDLETAGEKELAKEFRTAYEEYVKSDEFAKTGFDNIVHRPKDIADKVRQMSKKPVPAVPTDRVNIQPSILNNTGFGGRDRPSFASTVKKRSSS